MAFTVRYTGFPSSTQLKGLYFFLMIWGLISSLLQAWLWRLMRMHLWFNLAIAKAHMRVDWTARSSRIEISMAMFPGIEWAHTQASSKFSRKEMKEVASVTEQKQLLSLQRKAWVLSPWMWWLKEGLGAQSMDVVIKGRLGCSVHGCGDWEVLSPWMWWLRRPL